MARKSRRDLRKARYWRQQHEEQLGSGLSIRAFCQERGLSESGFHWWKRQLARRDDRSPITPAGNVLDAAIAPVESTGPDEGRRAGAAFAEITPLLPGRALPAERSLPSRREPAKDSVCLKTSRESCSEYRIAAAGIEVRLPRGRAVRVFPDFDESTFLRVIALLEGGGSC